MLQSVSCAEARTLSGSWSILRAVVRDQLRRGGPGPDRQAHDVGVRAAERLHDCAVRVDPVAHRRRDGPARRGFLGAAERGFFLGEGYYSIGRDRPNNRFPVINVTRALGGGGGLYGHGAPDHGRWRRWRRWRRRGNTGTDRSENNINVTIKAGVHGPDLVTRRHGWVEGLLVAGEVVDRAVRAGRLRLRIRSGGGGGSGLRGSQLAKPKCVRNGMKLESYRRREGTGHTRRCTDTWGNCRGEKDMGWW